MCSFDPKTDVKTDCLSCTCKVSGNFSSSGHNWVHTSKGWTICGRCRKVGAKP